VQVQELVQALQEAQERVLELAQEQVRVLGLAAAQVQELERAQRVALEWDLQGSRRALVQVEEQVEVLEPGWARGPLVEL
jgi:hypothetical protein